MRSNVALGITGTHTQRERDSMAEMRKDNSTGSWKGVGGTEGLGAIENERRKGKSLSSNHGY